MQEDLAETQKNFTKNICDVKQQHLYDDTKIREHIENTRKKLLQHTDSSISSLKNDLESKLITKNCVNPQKKSTKIVYALNNCCFL